MRNKYEDEVKVLKKASKVSMFDTVVIIYCFVVVVFSCKYSFVRVPFRESPGAYYYYY
jgi:hypothetical protein